MSFTLIICLVLIGFILLALEILVFPGTSVAGIIGLGALVYSVYASFATHGDLAGWVVLASVLVFSIIFLVVILRGKTWRKFQLDAAIDGKVNMESGRVKTGQTGLTVSRLAPTGTVEIDGAFYEAQSLLSFIDQRIPVQVVRVEGSKIWVKEAAVPGRNAQNTENHSPGGVGKE